MSNRSAKFVSAIVAGILAGANFSAVAQDAPAAADSKTADSKAADSCLSGPKGAAPAGSHWYYHIERGTKRHCWYVGEEKGKTAKAETAKAETSKPETAEAAPAPQDASSSAPVAETAASTPAPQGAPMRKSVANARAELPAPQANAAQGTTAADTPSTSNAAADNFPSAATADAGAPPSAVSSRWPDPSSVSSTSDPRFAAAGPPASARADAQPESEPAPVAAPVALAAADSADRQSSSTQTLLIVMAGALALAGLIGAVMLRLSRARKPPYEIQEEWRAPWDPVHSDRPSPPAFQRRDARMPRDDIPVRARDREPPMRRATAPRDPRPADDPDRRIAEMLQRLARTAAT